MQQSACAHACVGHVCLPESRVRTPDTMLDSENARRLLSTGQPLRLPSAENIDAVGAFGR